MHGGGVAVGGVGELDELAEVVYGLSEERLGLVEVGEVVVVAELHDECGGLGLGVVEVHERVDGAHVVDDAFVLGLVFGDAGCGCFCLGDGFGGGGIDFGGYADGSLAVVRLVIDFVGDVVGEAFAGEVRRRSRESRLGRSGRRR